MTYNNELRLRKISRNHEAYILSMRDIQSSIDFIKDIERGRLILEKC